MSAINTSKCSGTSQITPELVLTLETQLKIHNSTCEDSIKEYEMSNSTMLKKIQLKYSQLKSMKKEVSNSKNRIEELKKTLQDLQRSSKELSEHTSMLKADIESYDRESIALVEEQNKSLEKAEAKWKIYKENYEQRPLAVQLRKEEFQLERAKIEVMVKQYKLLEKKKVIAVSDAIHKEQRNCLVIECAGIWKEARSEEKKTREALEMQKKLRGEIERQETMMKALMEEKRKERRETLEKISANKSEGKRKAANLSTLQFQRIKIPRKFMPQPIPNWWNNNSDNISICSTMIDELIEPTVEMQITGSDKTDRSDSVCQRKETSQTAEAGYLEKLSIDAQMKKPIVTGKEKPFVDKNEAANRCYAIGETNYEDVPNTSAIPADDVDAAESEAGGAEERGDRSREEERYESLKIDKVNEAGRETREMIIGRSQESTINNPGHEIRTPNQRPEINHGVDDSKEREIQPRNKARQPIVKSIETVKFSLPFGRPIGISKPVEPEEEDSLSQFLHHDGDLGSEFSWKRSNRGDSLYAIGDPRRDAELDSILGSQMSLQSEEMMKRFHLALDASSELGINKDEEDLVSMVNENDRRPGTSQTKTDGFASNRSPTASPFVGTGISGSTPGNRDRENRFFINMF